MIRNLASKVKSRIKKLVYTPYYPDMMINDIVYFISCLNQVEGDYCEFGTADGTSFVKYYNGFKSRKKYLRKFNEMSFWAFDSFEGMPEIEGLDKEYPHFWKKGDYNYSEEEFRKILIRENVNIDKVNTVKGFYKDVLNDELKKNIPLKSIAVAYVDCDLYESTKVVLDFIKGYLVSGSIIIFNDWWAYKGNPQLGEQRAFREWLEQNPDICANEFIRAGYKDVSFVINKVIGDNPMRKGDRIS